MRKTFLATLSLSFTCLSSPAISMPSSGLDVVPDGINFDIGESLFKKAELSRERIALRWNWDRDFLATPKWRLDGYFELGYSRWRSHLSTGDTRSLYAADKAWQVSLSPVFRLTSESTPWSFVPFFDFGIGASYQSEKDLEQKRLSAINMGGHTQFEIRAMVGAQFGASKQFEIAYGWYHYSNAYLHKDNEGLDFQTLSVHYHW